MQLPGVVQCHSSGPQHCPLVTPWCGDMETTAPDPPCINAALAHDCSSESLRPWVQNLCIVNFCLQTLMLNQTEPKTLVTFSFPVFFYFFSWRIDSATLLGKCWEMVKVLKSQCPSQKGWWEVSSQPCWRQEINTIPHIFALCFYLLIPSSPSKTQQFVYIPD